MSLGSLASVLLPPGISLPVTAGGGCLDLTRVLGGEGASNPKALELVLCASSSSSSSASSPPLALRLSAAAATWA